MITLIAGIATLAAVFAMFALEEMASRQHMQSTMKHMLGGRDNG